MIRKVAIISALVALVSMPVVIDQLPLPLLTWVQAAVANPDLLRAIDGHVTEFDGRAVDHVFPVPGRTDYVVVLFAGQGAWTYVEPDRLLRAEGRPNER